MKISFWGMRISGLPAVVCAFGALSGCAGETSLESIGSLEDSLTTCVKPVANLVINNTTTLCPGTYSIGDPEGDGAIKVTANNVVLTVSGVNLTGTGTGYGITAIGKNGVTIKSAPSARAQIKNFVSAILIDGGASHRIEENILSSNAKRPLTHGDGDFLAVWEDYEGQLALQQIGNGIVLRNVQSATILNNQMRLQQNGIGLFSSNNVTMQGNDCSDNQGWGIHLHGSSNNTIQNNRADNVHLGASTFCHDVQNDGCDTAAILVIKASNSNNISNNSFKNSGDGIFSAGRQGDHQWGADHNRYVGNNVSFAKHLGIEATFGTDLVVENNIVDRADRSGIWLGGSTYSIVRGNVITNSGWSGIENEGTHHFTIENNTITGSAQYGIFLRSAPWSDSTDYTITRNTISGSGNYGILAQDTHSLSATGNILSNNHDGSMQLELKNESRLSGPITINESQLLDGTKACGGLDVKCGCSVFDGDATTCEASGCDFFACSNRCEKPGTSPCDAGCSESCTGSCSDHDGDVASCDAAGCAYYYCGASCNPPGTPEEVACACRPHDGDEAGCNAAPGCSYHPCNGTCHFDDTSDCNAGCASECGGTNVDCPIDTITTITSNYWGTSNPATIDAAICGANLNFVPFKTAP